MGKEVTSHSGSAGFDFVELDRTFHELSKYASENDDIDVSRVFHVGERLGWADLLKEYRLVLLSEAGSGKTRELQNTARSLRAEGKLAFFLRLEHLADDFDIAFELPGERREFQSWLDGAEDGWLLLDSVDEARLRDPKDFERAIRKLAVVIETAKERAHIVITGRSTAWRPKTDLALCTAQLPFTKARNEQSGPASSRALSNQIGHNDEDELDEDTQTSTTRNTKDSSSIFKVVTLDDLTPEQVTRFARARGIDDPRAFQAAIERADAAAFTARPQDLEELTGFWLDNARIGSRLELMGASINRRLAERDENRSDARPISPEKLRLGAQMLALATTLAHDPTIRIPDGADNRSGISAKDVLADWDDRDIATLLQRPVFDDEIYGRVRFHHRSVREYLAAELISNLLNRATSRRSIEDIFFRQQYGIEVVVPTSRPLLPWLVLLDDKVRSKVRAIAPEIFFEGGDPSRLPLELRQSILNQICQQIAEGKSDRHDFAAVQRFSSPELTDDVRRLFREHGSNNDLKSFLLRMIWLGELKGALPEAMSVALDGTCEHYARTAAFRAVVAIGSKDDIDMVRATFLAEGNSIDREWLSELLDDLKPTPESLAWLIAALRKSSAKERYTVDNLMETVPAYVDAAPAGLLPAIVSEFNFLLSLAPHIERHFCNVSKRYEWLLSSAGQAVERLITLKHPAAIAPDALAVLTKLAAARAYQSEELSTRRLLLGKAVPEWPEVNRALFWASIEEVRASPVRSGGERIVDHWRASSFGAFWSFGPGDFGYIVDCVRLKPSIDDKLVALSLAFELYRNTGRSLVDRALLRTAAKGFPEVEERLRLWLSPPKQSEAERGFRKQERDWKRRDEERRRKTEANHADWRKHLSENLESIRQWHSENPGEMSNAGGYLFQRLRENSSFSQRWTRYNWPKLKAEFGDDVATFYRDTMVSFWRSAKTPVIRSEGAAFNQTPNYVIYGLTGLEIEARETRDWAASLSDDEVLLACRYASFELNGFPVWFPDFYKAHPKIVGDFLMQEIRFELSIEKPNAELSYILSDVSWSGQWAWDELAPAVYALLKKGEPKTLFNLDKLLKILQGSSLKDGPVAELAAKRARASKLEHAGRWYAVWVGVDPTAAIPALRARLASIQSLSRRTTLAMNFVTNLWGGRRSEGSFTRPAFQTATHLKSLYTLMHEHIRLQDDIERAGKGVYSPGMRDNAQDARNSLYEQLIKMPGKDAFIALSEIAAMQPERPWLARHPRSKAEQEADLTPWTPAETREFCLRLEHTPRTHRDLANLAVMRLLDLRDDIEHGDSSVANVLMKVDLETDMRKFIGRDLRDKAFGRYAIAQEEELADAKKPDLRFLGMGFDAPVPAELKLSDKWSGPQLMERLENQLCGDYLRDNRSNRGLFVLVNQRPGMWQMADGRSVDFDGLVQSLRERWDELENVFPNVDDVQVIGIDLTKRKRAAA